MHTYAVGDIHGQFDQLVGAHELIAQDMQEHGFAPIVHVGDLGDRGPDSASVIEYLRLGIAQGEEWIVIKGNHDRLFTQFMDDPKNNDPGLSGGLTWLHPRLGGSATLDSYGVENAFERPVDEVHSEALSKVPHSHIQFLKELPNWQRIGGTIFVHAGIKPTVVMEEQKEDDLLWIRREFLTYTKPHEALIVHGHTAVEIPTRYDNRVNIDSGAAYGRALSAIVIDGDNVFWLTQSGRIAL